MGQINTLPSAKGKNVTRLYLEGRPLPGQDGDMSDITPPSTPRPSRQKVPDRAWQRMLSGRRLDILDPSPMDVEIIDIAHGLARVSRWNGQTKGQHPISVAQHSVMVERFVSQNAPKLDRRWRLAALLHDAPEYVIGDMITPFKYALGGIYRDIESRLAEAVHIRFGLPARLPDSVEKVIKRADRMAAWIEATQLAGFTPEEAGRILQRPRGTPDNIRLRPVEPEKAAEIFLKRFRLLGGDRG
jgi:5'-deoxynucleotidase YfbR-like HD superfamily hydrolase